MWNLPPVRAGISASDDLVKYRAGADEFTKSQPIAPGIVFADDTFGGVACLVCAPAAWSDTILYFHGGGFRLGRPQGWKGFGSRLAAAAGVRVVLLDYRLAPEHPYPAALHDGAAAYDALARETDGALFVGGDSAG